MSRFPTCWVVITLISGCGAISVSTEADLLGEDLTYSGLARDAVSVINTAWQPKNKTISVQGKSLPLVAELQGELDLMGFQVLRNSQKFENRQGSQNLLIHIEPDADRAGEIELQILANRACSAKRKYHLSEAGAIPIESFRLETLPQRFTRGSRQDASAPDEIELSVPEETTETFISPLTLDFQALADLEIDSNEVDFLNEVVTDKPKPTEFVAAAPEIDPAPSCSHFELPSGSLKEGISQILKECDYSFGRWIVDPLDPNIELDWFIQDPIKTESHSLSHFLSVLFAGFHLTAQVDPALRVVHFEYLPNP